MYLISNLQRLPMNIKLCFTLEYWRFTYILGIGICCFKFLTQALDHFSYNPANIPSWVLIRHYQMISQLHALCNNNLGQKGFCSTKVPDTSLQAWSRKDKARIGQLITMCIVLLGYETFQSFVLANWPENAVLKNEQSIYNGLNLLENLYFVGKLGIWE